jgi:hypothetical protein
MPTLDQIRIFSLVCGKSRRWYALMQANRIASANKDAEKLGFSLIISPDGSWSAPLTFEAAFGAVAAEEVSA